MAMKASFRNTLLSCGVAIAMTVGVSPSQSADVGPTSSVYSWNGLYIGGHAGWGEARWRISGTAGSGIFDQGGVFSTSLKDDDFFGGGTIGFNWQFDDLTPLGPLVIGVESDIGYMGIDESYTLNGDADVASQEYGFYATVTGRLGIAFDRFLPYVKGGLAIADIDLFAADSDGGAVDPTDATSSDETRSGYVIGGGLEYAVMDGWSLKAEYLYMDFASERSGNTDGDVWIHDNDVHTVKVGLNVQLGTLFGGM